MLKVLIAGLIVTGTAAAQAQLPTAAGQLLPGVDSVRQRESLRTFLTCIAQSRPGWARRTLSHAYLSDAQASAAAEALTGKDKCLRQQEVELTFRTSAVVGSLAEYFLPARIDAAGEARLARALNALTPRNSSEDFALCVASRNPGVARALALSAPGSSAETSAAARLAAYVPSCSNPGEQLAVELPSLRALVAVALYQGMAAGK